MKYLAAFLARFGGYLPPRAYETYETPETAPWGSANTYPHEPAKPTKPPRTAQREPGEDDDRPTDPAWLAEFNALIGRPIIQETAS